VLGGGLEIKLSPEEQRAWKTPGRSRYDQWPFYKSMEIRPWKPRAEGGEPAWRCGHPKTPKNMHGPFPTHPGQCKVCHRWARRRADLKWKDTMTPAKRFQRQIEDQRRKAREETRGRSKSSCFDV
jgi:hypothetical protein